jgi:predicted DNA-binding protein (MmcQ/YjbR family)
MTRQELIKHCLAYSAVYEDYPFDVIIDENSWALIRHAGNKKSFAIIYRRGGQLCVNLKCGHIEADFLRRAYKGVTPAYHMNKTHWNTVIAGGDISESELKAMIEKSYNLTKPKAKGTSQNEL